jgi:hypothetical protein
MSEARRDNNRVPTLLAVSNVDDITPVRLHADPVTHRLLVDLPAGSGTVTSVSVVTANGISGTVATATTTPAITLTLGVITPTSVNGLTLATAANGFTIAGGTTSKTLTIPLDASVSGINTGDNAANTTSNSYADGKVEDSIVDGHTTIAPSGNAVFDALALKAPLTAPTFATSITGSYLTASEILITDGSKNIVSAPVATYPSLTELSYVKGLSSAIQTQLGAKAPSANPTFTGTVILPKTIEIQDTSADNQYVLAVNELTADRTITLPLLTGNDEFTFNSHTQTLNNKRKNPRLVTATSYTTDTGSSLDVSTCDQFEVTAQAGDLKLNNPGGTPLGGQKLIVRIKDNGNARALTYDTQFRAMGTALPSTTVLLKTLYLGFIYNATDTKWDLVAAAQEA